VDLCHDPKPWNILPLGRKEPDEIQYWSPLEITQQFEGRHPPLYVSDGQNIHKATETLNSMETKEASVEDQKNTCYSEMNVYNVNLCVLRYVKLFNFSGLDYFRILVVLLYG
jgi:hypothetical protein